MQAAHNLTASLVSSLVDTLGPVIYGRHMAERQESDTFQEWLDDLPSEQALARIIVQVERLAETGHGDVRYLGDKIYEPRIHHGPGYRIYFVRNPGYFLLCGGTKGTQSRDITRARRLAKELQDDQGNDRT